jgi:hypothetical protein
MGGSRNNALRNPGICRGFRFRALAPRVTRPLPSYTSLYKSLVRNLTSSEAPNNLKEVLDRMAAVRFAPLGEGLHGRTT